MKQLDLGVMLGASTVTGLVVVLFAPRLAALCGLVAGVFAGVLEATFRRAP